jgi:hypothetical protein
MTIVSFGVSKEKANQKRTERRKNREKRTGSLNEKQDRIRQNLANRGARRGSPVRRAPKRPKLA